MTRVHKLISQCQLLCKKVKHEINTLADSNGVITAKQLKVQST